MLYKFFVKVQLLCFVIVKSSLKYRQIVENNSSVSNIFARKSENFVKLHFGGDSVVCTPEHPFFVNNTWLEAKDIKAGDSLFVYSGYKVELDSVFSSRTDTAVAVFNLEADGNHNFYVSASGVLVHNKNPKNVTKLADDVMDWLGKGATKNYNKAGDPYFMSKDGLRKVRWDWNKTSPHDYKHMHFEVFKNGKWKDAVKGKSQIGKWYLIK